MRQTCLSLFEFSMYFCKRAAWRLDVGVQRATSEKRKSHYAWVVAGVTFLILLVTAGIRATPSILIVPLEHEFGWTTAAISGAIAVNIALFGIIGPFAASFMARYGLRKIVLWALALLAFAVAFSSTMHHQWELMLFWGILVGTGTGVTALVLAAVVVNRWFAERRGLVLGLLTAANATGQLVFLPLLAKLVTAHGWRSAVYFVAGIAGLVFLVVLFWMKDSPSDVGLLAYGARPQDSLTVAGVPHAPLQGLVWAAKSREFWILAGSFFVCGASTNGLIGTHLIPACIDHGISEVRAAGLLAVMGVFDLAGTTFSGWLTDRFNSRYLLFWYYALRGLSLLVSAVLPRASCKLALVVRGVLRIGLGRHGSAHGAPHHQHFRQGKRRRSLRMDRRVASTGSLAGSAHRRNHPHLPRRLSRRFLALRRTLSGSPPRCSFPRERPSNGLTKL